MKTFKDLEFKEHPNYPSFDKQAKIHFENKYGVSVVSGMCAYSSESKPYEVAVLYEDSITYNTDITDDVIGYQTEEEVSAIMKQVQELKQ